MKISLNTGDRRVAPQTYDAQPPKKPSTTLEIDGTQVAVRITEAFIGPLFISPDGEQLTVYMRDSGFEMSYRPHDQAPWRPISAKGGDVTTITG